MYKRYRRGVMLFNWIFILIVGAVLLAVFVTLSMKQINLHREEMSISTANKINSVLKAAIDQGQSYQKVTIPLLGQKEMKTICIKSTTGTIYSSRIGGADISFAGVLPFIPRTLRGSSQTVVTYPLKIPFPISIGVGLTNKKYYVDESLKNYVLLPEHLLTDSQDNADIIVSTSCSGSYSGYRKCYEVEIINEGEPIRGNITIKEQNYPFVTKELLTLGIISGENYPCVLELLKKELSLQISILTKRSELLEEQDIDYYCRELLINARDYYESINETINIHRDDQLYLWLDSLYDNYIALSNLEEETYRKNCPNIY